MAKKTVNSDIYNSVGLVNDVFKTFLPNESDQTLAIGLYGAIQSVEAKRLQTQVRMTGELCNESFPSRARLERNVITHAIMANIEDINAVPAKMTTFLAIKEADMLDYLDSENKFYIDRECPIYLGDFEFHLEYDIIVQRIYLAGNRNAYTAQYDISRKNPNSTIVNPYLPAPSVVFMENDAYIYFTAVISQVIHNTEYKKLVTSNVIDNKTINFEFNEEEQLAYFEVHCIETEDEFYLTPVFEGSAVPDDTSYYCWYQYIDTNLVRVRFDRTSYMPGLNAQIEVQYKTTKGSEGNFTYRDSTFYDLYSDKYGYKGLTTLITPVTNSANGKDRKSKKELQGLIPKELLARGSLTTITDLNNYFGMLDSDYGRIVIQKKIDNQQERVYYAYLLLKDENYNVIPSNTIDLKVEKDQMIESRLNDSDSSRFVIQSGACIRLGDDGVGYISNEPIKNVGVEYTTKVAQTRGKSVTLTFRARIDDDSYATMSAMAKVNDISTVVLNMPRSEHNVTVIDDDDEILIEDYMMVSPGRIIEFDMPINILSKEGTINISDTLPEYLDFVRCTYTEGSSSTQSRLENSSTESNKLRFSFNIDNAGKYTIKLFLRINENIDDTTEIDHTVNITCNTETFNPSFKIYVPTFEVNSVPETLDNGSVYTYTLTYKSTSNSILPKISIELSRGLTYVPYSSELVYEDGNTYKLEPTVQDIADDIGFIYTNPYSIVINKYRLYSAFYMMSMNENPYLHFDYINQKSIVQFIATNIQWVRPFQGFDRDKYTMSITITQSVQEDLGLIPDEGEPFVKCIAVFYRNGVVYRYRTLDLIEMDQTTNSFTFAKSFTGKDLLDNDNNIRIEGMEVVGQQELDSSDSQYGYFNPTTEVKIYALCGLEDIEGKYTRYDLDNIVPGLDLDSDGISWNVTNTYEVVNGITMYHNYSEVMGSRAIPYGTVDSNGVMDTEGYIIKGVPVFGYDYCQDEDLVQIAIDTLNFRKSYLDSSLELLENSFNIDFKFFNTFGPSKTYYIIKDNDNNNILDDTKEYIDKINLSMYFRVRLVQQRDSYTRSNIIKDIKDYIEDLDDIGDLHIPNLVTQITNTYKEQITYFEYLGFNKYGADIQHIFRDPTDQTDIHICPEFLNIHNVKSADNSLTPDINIYVSET